MKKDTHGVLKFLRFACLTGVILLGFITIIGTSGDDDTTSVSDTLERGVYKFIVTEVDVDDVVFDHYVNTRKLDMENDEDLVEEKTEYYDAEQNLIKEVEDHDGDTKPDYENEFDYTAGEDGVITEGRYGYYDGNGILQISNVIKYTYYVDEQGDNLKTQELDNDYDGTFEADAAYE